MPLHSVPNFQMFVGVLNFCTLCFTSLHRGELCLLLLKKEGGGKKYSEFSIVLDIHVNAKKKNKDLKTSSNYTVLFFLKEMLFYHNVYSIFLCKVCNILYYIIICYIQYMQNAL